MFANAVMYNKTNTEIVKETNIMAKDVEAMVNNFRGAEEVGTRKALAAKEKEVGGAATWGGRRNLFQREETGEKEKDRARTESVASDAMEKGGSERGGGSGVGGSVGGSGGRSMEEDAVQQEEEEEEEEGESGKEEEDNEDDAKSADGTLTEEHVQVPKKRGRPKRRKEEEMEED